MAIVPFNRDPLEFDLKAPVLDDFMHSRDLYAILQGIGQEIVRGYQGRVPHDSGDLASTAKVSMRRSTHYADRRWEAEVSVGNARVDYAAVIEERDHPLADTLRALGFGDVSI